jgi:hypothetical protein
MTMALGFRAARLHEVSLRSHKEQQNHAAVVPHRQRRHKLTVTPVCVYIGETAVANRKQVK